MKKFLLPVLTVLLFLAAVTAHADYVTYFDVINDVKLLLGDAPDAAWEMSREVAERKAAGLSGFSCSNAGASLICVKNHWSGDFKISLFFTEDKLSAVGCEFTAPAIRDLNYGPDMTYIPVVEDLTSRLKNSGLIPADSPQSEGDLFPNAETSSYGPVYGTGSNTLLQAGYNPKSAANPGFGMAFMAASGDFADQAGAGEISLPGSAAEQESGKDPFPGSWNMVLYYTVREDGSPLVSAASGSGMWKLMFGFDRMQLIFKEDGTFQRRSSLGTEIKVVSSTWKKENDTIILDGDAAVLENDSVIRSCVFGEENLICTLDGQLGDAYAKVEFEYAEPLTEEQQEALLKLLMALYEQSQAGESQDQETQDQVSQAREENAEDPGGIVLTVSDNVHEAGTTVRINVKAPGAEQIRLYSEGVSNPRKEGWGDSLEYTYSSYTASPYPDVFYAAASYNGVWSSERSNSEKITIIPAKALKYDSPEVVRTGETFSLGIYEVENVSKYDVKITDGSGNIVRQEQRAAGYQQIDPLPEGEYKLTVTCVGSESHTVTSNIRSTDKRPTGYSVSHAEPAEISDDIILTVPGEAVETGIFAKITVKAAGADSIRIRRPESERILKEAEGDYLEYEFTRAEPMTETLVAEASYNGEWSKAQSAPGTVTFVAAKCLGFYIPEPVNSGETFSIGIYPVENVLNYDVRIADGAGSPVREVRLASGFTDLDPLAAGSYKVTVTCVEDPSHSLTADLTVSDELPTGSPVIYREDDEEQKASDRTQTQESTAVSADDKVIGSWHLAYYTTLINGQPDMENSYFDSDGTMGRSPLGVDSYDLIFYPDGTLDRQETLDGNVTVEKGTWSRSGDEVFITYESGENVGPFRFSNEDLAIRFPDEDGVGLHWQFKRTGDAPEKQAETEMTQEDAAAAVANTLADTMNGLNEYNLGNAYYNGNGVEKDDEQAFYWWKQAAEHGVVPAYGSLGWAYSNGIGVEQDDERSVYWWKKGAEAGNTYSQGRLGYAYINGRGVEKDPAQAVYWWEKAAGQSDATPDTQFNAGYAYYLGDGVDQDYEKAVYLLQKAAEQGYADAQSLLAQAYFYGNGVEADVSQAFSLWKKAAEQNFIPAQYQLGICYANGQGVEQDDEQAVYWWKKSAEQGYLLSMNNLGIYLYQGKGTEEDPEQAISWLQKAAEQNTASSQFTLGVIYGTDEEYKDMDKAKYWLELSAGNGYERANDMLARLFPED